jgi:hypothetical protein
MCQGYEAEANFMRAMEHSQHAREYESKGKVDCLAGRYRPPYTSKDGTCSTTYGPWIGYRDTYLKGWGSSQQMSLPGVG